jgi:hypothetical protein
MDAEDASVVPGPSSLAGAELQGCEGLVAEGLAADDRDQSRHKSAQNAAKVLMARVGHE